MSIRFVAARCVVVRENGVLTTALSEAPNDEDEEAGYLILQCSMEHNEQDVRLGMNQPHVEFSRQAWSWYGHILAISLSRNSVEVKLDSVAAEQMQNDGQIEVAFELDEPRFTEFRSALRETFNGRAYFRDVV